MELSERPPVFDAHCSLNGTIMRVIAVPFINNNAMLFHSCRLKSEGDPGKLGYTCIF